ncbi:hypothetical protein Pmani_015711 [Petrolisthes manimaculis]|uniref:Uncharacterized protein n=1 Tax=Petrolisthes manimaculis TaxID=1843537 RepID=A0AAE1PQF0_9EUCA|nr:hypothetical protein Pmani_015711 [Petrolisthes manimaculis]
MDDAEDQLPRLVAPHSCAPRPSHPHSLAPCPNHPQALILALLSSRYKGGTWVTSGGVGYEPGGFFPDVMAASEYKKNLLPSRFAATLTLRPVHFLIC